jgi:hypothetical protein
MARTSSNGSSPRAKSKSTTKKLSTHEKIAVRAYEFYLERNGVPGDPLEDWVRAEREILAKAKRSSKKSAATAA